MLAYQWPVAMLALAIGGLALIWRQARSTALLLIGPGLICMGAALAGSTRFAAG